MATKSKKKEKNKECDLIYFEDTQQQYLFQKFAKKNYSVCACMHTEYLAPDFKTFRRNIVHLDKSDCHSYDESKLK